MRSRGMFVLLVSFSCALAAHAQTSTFQRSMPLRDSQRTMSDRPLKPGNTLAGSFRSVSLPPIHIRTADYSCLSAQPCIVGDPGYPAVGYRRNAGRDGSITGAGADIMELGVAFDLAPLHGRAIDRATLHLRVMASHQNSDSSLASYIEHINLAQSPWWNDKAWIGSVTGVTVAPQRGPDASYDVTQIVRMWTSAPSGFDYGFVLMGGDNNLRDEAVDRSAISQYAYDSSLSLEVHYH